MIRISFFRISEGKTTLYLEVLTDSYYVDFATKKICFHRTWRGDWVDEKYDNIFIDEGNNGIIKIRVES
jgi:hypothetical protein